MGFVDKRFWFIHNTNKKILSYHPCSAYIRKKGERTGTDIQNRSSARGTIAKLKKGARKGESHTSKGETQRDTKQHAPFGGGCVLQFGRGLGRASDCLGMTRAVL
jgi:hypothetical protein